MIKVLNGKDKYMIDVEVSAFIEKYVPTAWQEYAVFRYQGGSANEKEIIEEVSTPPFGAPHKVIVIDHFNGFARQNAILEIVEAASSECHLVLIQEAPGKTPIKLNNWVKKNPKLAEWIIFYPPNEKTLEKRILQFFKSKNIRYEEEAVQYLSQSLKDQPDFLMGELEKIEMYLEEGDKMYDMACLRKLISKYHDQEVWDLIDCIFSKNIKKALLGFNGFIEQSGNFVSLIMIIQGEVYRVLQYKELEAGGHSSGDIFKAMSVYYYKLQEKIQTNSKKYSLAQLKGMIIDLSELERILKNESLTDGAVDKVKLNIIGKSHMLRFILKACQ